MKTSPPKMLRCIKPISEFQTGNTYELSADLGLAYLVKSDEGQLLTVPKDCFEPAS